MKQTLKWFYYTYCEKNISLASFYREVSNILKDNKFGKYKYRTLSDEQVQKLLEEYPYLRNSINKK